MVYYRRWGFFFHFTEYQHVTRKSYLKYTYTFSAVDVDLKGREPLDRFLLLFFN